MADFKRKHLSFKMVSNLNLKWLSGRIGTLSVLTILLVVGFIIFSGTNHQDIISEGLSDPALKENVQAESGVFLKKTAVLAVNDSNGSVKQTQSGEGGGIEGIMEYIIIEGNNLVNVHASDISLAGKRNEIITYEVQVGDTLGSVAEYHDISIETLLWANLLTAKSIIKPGMKLEILPITGLKHLVNKNETLNGIAAYYKTDIDKIIAFNDLPADGQIIAGKSIIVPDGKKPAVRVAVASAGSSLALRYGTTPGAPSIITAPVDAGYFIYPTTGRNWGKIHGFNGVDVATSCGTQIYAAADGDILTALGSGWNGGYGKYVRMRHPNGVITVYGHMSKVLVRAGESVVKGQIIGLVGSTGRSTGCHLHFEVRGATNPLAKK